MPGGARDATIRQCVVLAPDGDALFDLLRDVSRFGVEDVLLLCRHTPDRAMQDLAARLPRPLAINVLSVPGSDGAALLQARGRLHPRFLLCHGYSQPGANLARLLAAARQDPPGIVGHLLIRADPAGAGIGVFDHRLLAELDEACSLARDVLPRLSARGALRNTGAWPGPARRRALFLDRDGTINIDHGYVGTLARFDWIDGALDAIRMASDAGWHVFIVTNQSGVARGLYDEAAVTALHAWLAEQVRRAGGTIDDVRYCPYHPDAAVAAYRRVSDWRKPAPGMVQDLLRAWALDPADCIMVGDQPGDIEAAEAAGVPGFRFGGGNLATFIAPLLHRPAPAPA